MLDDDNDLQWKSTKIASIKQLITEDIWYDKNNPVSFKFIHASEALKPSKIILQNKGKHFEALN